MKARPDMLLQPRLLRELNAPLELLLAFRHSSEQLHRPDVVERVDQDLGLVKALGELERTRRPGDGPLGVLRVHTERREVAVRHGELAAGWELLKQRDSLPAGLLGFCYAASTPEQARERAKRVSLFAPVAVFPAALKRALVRLDRLIELVGEVAFVGAALEEFGPRLGRQASGEPECAGVLRRGLAVRMGVCRAFAGGSRISKHGLRISGRFRMVGEAGRVDRSQAGQRGQHDTVKFVATVSRDRVLDGQARELVAERHVALNLQHPGRQAFLEGCEGPPAIVFSRGSSTRAGMTATHSSSLCAAGRRRAARDETASRTVAGTSAPPALSTSVT